MTWFLGGFAVFLLADALRLRSRIRALRLARECDVPPDPGHIFVPAPGVEIDAATRRAVSAFARENELEVVDIVPADRQASSAIVLVQLVRPRTMGTTPFALARSAGYGVMCTEDVARRADIGDTPPTDPASFIRLVARVKLFACRTTAYAVVPSASASPVDVYHRREVVRELLGQAFAADFDWLVIAMPAMVAGILMASLWLVPLWGALALGAYHLQPAIAFAGGPLRPRDRWRYAALRSFVDFWISIVCLFDRRGLGSAREREETARAAYADLIAGGTDRFFRRRVQHCPHCFGGRLSKMFSTRDHFQQKPGSFTLERCADCGHVFQNPQLSSEGLSYYYRDFYDGLGAELTERVFSAYGDVYRDRALMMKVYAEPQRWLDVGCGHGHFCCVAQQELPRTEFHGLDQSESVLEAFRRRWLHVGHRGAFPDLATGLAGMFDAVSMHHYMEHVVDPAAELDAAATVLRPGGHVLIELPDPESVLGNLLGRWWVHWLQPQHLHFLSMGRLEELLTARGFRVLARQRAEAHMPIDLAWAVILLLQEIAPKPDQPWRPLTMPHQRLWRRVVWAAGAPFVVVAGLADLLVKRFAAPLRSTNFYRLVARLDNLAERPRHP